MAHANSELLVLKFLRFVLVCVCVWETEILSMSYDGFIAWIHSMFYEGSIACPRRDS